MKGYPVVLQLQPQPQLQPVSTIYICIYIILYIPSFQWMRHPVMRPLELRPRLRLEVELKLWP